MVPPLVVPIGWTPNALSPTNISVVNQAVAGGNGTSALNSAGVAQPFPLAAGVAFQLPFGLSFLVFQITNAQLLSGAALDLFTPGIGGICVPSMGALVHLNSTAGAYGSNTTISLRYANGTTDLVSPVNGAQTVAGERWVTSSSGVSPNHGANNPYGQIVRAIFSAGNTGGNAANSLFYSVSVMTTRGY